MTQGLVRDQAIAWIIRLRDPASADWAAFTDWLTADQAHAAAYEAVTLADADMAEAMFAHPVSETKSAPEAAANDNAPGRLRRYASVAAGVLVLAGAYPVWQIAMPTYAIETALGEQRSVTLSDGTVIDLNGGTRVTLDRRNPRLAKLDEGEARFRVTHDPENPFTVMTGDTHIEDVGTVFNVAREGKQTEISVAEGAVLYNPKRDALLLKPGQMLRVEGAGKPPRLTDVDPGSVAGWTKGRLDFTATRLADIAPDLSRALGVTVDVDPAVTGRQFTGTILVDRADGDAMIKIAALMGISARKVGEGWRLTAD